MMNGFGMGFGGLWMLLLLVLAGLAIAALIKYLRK
jgi:hypothetical protein